MMEIQIWEKIPYMMNICQLSTHNFPFILLETSGSLPYSLHDVNYGKHHITWCFRYGKNDGYSYLWFRLISVCLIDFLECNPLLFKILLTVCRKNIRGFKSLSLAISAAVYYFLHHQKSSILFCTIFSRIL